MGGKKWVRELGEWRPATQELVWHFPGGRLFPGRGAGGPLPCQVPPSTQMAAPQREEFQTLLELYVFEGMEKKMLITHLIVILYFVAFFVLAL